MANRYYLAAMSRYYSYLNSATEIIKQYRGEEPLASYLKKYFALHKKYGSKDRKQVSHLCYCYYRLGKAAASIAIEEGIIQGLFLCSVSSNDTLEKIKPEWTEFTHLALVEKLKPLPNTISVEEIFPFMDELSNSINSDDFAHSFFVQPDLFLRIRPGYEETVKAKIKSAQLSFKTIGDTCISLPNNTKIDEVVELDKEAVVQDYSSQRVGEMLKLVKEQQQKKSFKVWDCCAASGGKSILAKDTLGDIKLTVSDIRESILANLKKRLSRAEVNFYKASIIDLKKEIVKDTTYQLIICDAPCSGSGTWGRTPEQLFFFEKKKIEEYSQLQRKIAANALQSLEAGGYFLYITCSVFKKENEDVVQFLLDNQYIKLIRQQIFEGYTSKADTMFAALMQKV